MKLSNTHMHDIISCTYDISNIINNNINNIKVTTKSDGSLVTNIDKIVEDYIIQFIQNIDNNPIIVAEESIATKNYHSTIKDPFWLVDPIDSTHSFIKSQTGFCTNITYLENNLPVFAIIYNPITKDLYYAIKGQGSFKITNNSTHQIKVRTQDINNVIAVCSHKSAISDAIKQEYNIKEIMYISSALKICHIAEGKADLYIKPQAYDWDLASGDLIVQEAGGSVTFNDPTYKYGVAPYLCNGIIFKSKI